MLKVRVKLTQAGKDWFKQPLHKMARPANEYGYWIAGICSSKCVRIIVDGEPKPRIFHEKFFEVV